MFYCDEILSSFKRDGMYSVFSVIRSQDVILYTTTTLKRKKLKKLRGENRNESQNKEYQLFFFSSSYF